MKNETASKALARLNDQVIEAKHVKDDFFAKHSTHLIDVAEEMGKCIASGGKILICGNGGSAADAQHFSGELVGRFLKERRPLPAISLTTDTSTLTAIGNDYGYDQVFSRGVQALGNPGDMLFAISTSGKSPNVLKAVDEAHKKNMKVVAMTGDSGGPLGEIADFHLNVSQGKNSPRIQEVHIMIVHILVDILDEYYLKG